jgi:hypothetical protein
LLKKQIIELKSVPSKIKSKEDLSTLPASKRIKLNAVIDRFNSESIVQSENHRQLSQFNSFNRQTTYIVHDSPDYNIYSSDSSSSSTSSTKTDPLINFVSDNTYQEKLYQNPLIDYQSNNQSHSTNNNNNINSNNNVYNYFNTISCNDPNQSLADIDMSQFTYLNYINYEMNF